jgi:hypothetical protein
MRRFAFPLGLLLLAALVALLAYQAVNNPVAAMRAELRTELDQAREVPDQQVDDAADTDFQQMVNTVARRPDLWRTIVPPPPPPPKPPNWSQMLSKVIITPQIIGEGDDMKVKIKIGPNDPGRWVEKGSRISSAVVTSVDGGGIHLQVTQRGIEYKHYLRRR